MSQSDVMKVLKESKKEMCVRDIDDILDINVNNITRALNKLYKNGKNTLGLKRRKGNGFKYYWSAEDLK